MTRRHRVLALLNLLLAGLSFAIGLAEPARPTQGTPGPESNTHPIVKAAAS